MKKTFIKVMALCILSAPLWADSARLLRDNSEALSARSDLIQSASQEILVEYFVARNDASSRGGLALLREAARNGVQVKIILDSMSHSVPLPMLAVLDEEPNLEIKLYHQLEMLRPGRAFKRLHDKLIAVDGNKIITGGRNVSDKYYGMTDGGFNDLDVLYKGDVAQNATDYFHELWKTDHVSKPFFGAFSKRELAKDYCGDEEDSMSCEDDQEWARGRMQEERGSLDAAMANIKAGTALVKYNSTKDWFADAQEVDSALLLFDAPTEDKNDFGISVKLAKLIEAKLEKEITILSPYVILSTDTQNFLKRLVGRGITVNIITNSMHSSDNILAQAGYNHDSTIGFLKDNGINIWEYKGPDTLHAKAAIIDGKSVIVGTYNFDPRSDALNRELALYISEKGGHKLASELSRVVEQFKENSLEVGSAEEKAAKKADKNFKSKLIKFLSFFSPLFKNQL